MAIHTTLWDSAEHLKTEEDIQLYLEAILEEADDDPALIVHALSIIARAKNINQIDSDKELGPSELHNDLTTESNPSFTTVAKAAKALGFKLTLQPTV